MNDLASGAAVFDSAGSADRSKNLPARTIDAEPSRNYSSFPRRMLDIAGALALSLVFSPVVACVAIALAFSEGSIVFSQVRVGRGGRQFKVYKFRTMVPDAPQVLARLLESDSIVREEWQKHFKLKDDPRITAIGRFLRKTSLDEIPQLWNILRGDMGLIGPRPVEPFEMVKYGRYARFYYGQKPGLTGLWQVSGSNSTGWTRRVALDVYYARNRTWLIDLAVIAKTVRVIFVGKGGF